MLLAITIISFNLRISTANDTIHSWPSRRDAVIAAVSDLKPDVLCVQECSMEQDSFLVSRLYNYTRLPQSDSITHPTQVVNAIYYNHHRLRAIRSSLFWLSTTPHIPSIDWGAAYPRVAVYGMFQDSVGHPLMVVNTHLDHISAQARTNGLDLIADTIAAFQQDSIPCFLTGDFNTSLPPQLGFCHSQLTLSHTPSQEATFHNYGNAPDGGAQIDYIFYLHATPITYQVIREGYGVPYLSDHYPILGKFEARGERR